MKSLITDIEFLSKTRQTYIDELSFAGRGLKLNTKDDVQEIVKSILNCKSMRVLRLEGNTISPEVAEELSKALMKHPELERFIVNDIFTGRLKDEIPLALKSLCGAIDKSGAHLVEINMSDNAFGPIGLHALVDFLESTSCFSLKEIRMHNNGLGPQGSQKFASALNKCLQNSGGQFKLKVFVCGRNRLEFEGAKSICDVLKKIGSLEEIQMPQNGIRPSAIEFLAEACMHNTELKIINFNDNTFLKSGAEWMSKALINLKKLEYLNLGDCLLKSKGALLIARAVTNLSNLKEIILSFNEINLYTGLEICSLLVKCNFKALQLIDLNGNKFGDDGKIEIVEILEPVKQFLASLSEDEGSDEEDQEEDDEVDSEEETSEVVVDDEYEDYDQVENEDYEEYEEENIKEKFSNFDIAKQQQQSLFNQLKTTATPSTPNLFSSLVKNNALLTNIKKFDDFILNPTINNLIQVEQQTIESVIRNPKFNGSFLIKFLSHLANIYDNSNSNNKIVLEYANNFCGLYLANDSAKQIFSDELLTEFGMLKSEEKQFRPIELTEKLQSILKNVFSQSYFPSLTKSTLKSFLNLRNDQQIQILNRKNYELLIKCVS